MVEQRNIKGKKRMYDGGAECRALSLRRVGFSEEMLKATNGLRKS
jgi:hypothetical protein